MTAIETIPEQFISLLNDADASSRRSKAEAILSSDLRYVDPHAPEEMIGREVYLDFLVMFKGKFPELQFQLDESAAHHDVAKVVWTLVKGHGSTFSRGEFVLDCEGGSQIRRIFGFMR